MQRGGKNKKCQEVVFHSQNWCQKIVLINALIFVFLNICEKHPLVGENCIQSLKKKFYKYLAYFFWMLQGGQI